MRIARLNPSKCDRKYCFVRGAFPYDTKLQRGGDVLDEMMEDGVERLEYELDEDEGGLEIPDYFTTTDNHLPVSRHFADAVAERFEFGPYEFVPARVKNQKGRIHVPDLAIVNPTEAIDCLDWDHSDLNQNKTYPMVRVFGKWSLRRERIPEGRDLFRVKGLIGYLFSERLVSFIQEQGFKNFVFEDARLA